MHSKYLWQCCHLLKYIQLHSSASTELMGDGLVLFFRSSIADKCNTGYVNSSPPGFLQILLPQDKDRVPFRIEDQWRELKLVIKLTNPAGSLR